MPRSHRRVFSSSIIWFALPLLALVWLAGSATAWALVCPPHEELQIVDGWWSAPKGWQQDRSYKKPSASARIADFAAASFQGNLRGPGKLMCLYVVDGQPGAEYTKIFHPSSGGPMDFDWDCPTATTDITCSCVGLKRGDCEVRD
ncbi:MAG: hypothetical protein ABIK12_12385 [Pseudomonadota bacterium]